jgi:uncharacterized pyridoxamine 5'-phosphate oxidase family protein
MDRQEYVKFATENPICTMATQDGDQPRVRTVMMWKADESGYYFVLLSQKDVVKQLKQNPKVELCFFNHAPDPMVWKQMRVTGQLEFLEDEPTLEEAYQSRSFLDNFAGYSLKPFVAPCRVLHGDAHFWTLQDVAKETAIPHLAF